MDRRFADKLQTTMQLLGREGEFAPPKSQDPMDKLVHEYFVCDAGKSIFTKRRDFAKDLIINNAQQDVVQAVISDAIKQNAKQTATLFSTEHYIAVLSVNKPVEKVDAKKMFTELLKLGVDEVTIKRAMDASTSTNEPAKSIIVTTTHTPGGK